MFIFYSPELDPQGLQISEGVPVEIPWNLNREESHHAVQVLRMEKGEKIQILNGRGGLFLADLERIDAKSCPVKILFFTQVPARKNKIHIVFSPTKNMDRIEWFLEKSTEIGVDEISFILCQNSERRILNEERLSKILISAVKQSGQAYMPKINPLQPFLDFMKAPIQGMGMMAHCRDTHRTPFPDAFKNSSTHNITVLIGPEGDFTEMEVEKSEEMGYIPISLGEMRLRTETAAILVCAQFALLAS